MSFADLSNWLAGLHPFLVHFPIALLFFLLLLELLNFRKLTDNPPRLSLVVLTAITLLGGVTLFSGLQLAELGSHPAADVSQHRDMAWLSFYSRLICLIFRLLLVGRGRQRLSQALGLEVLARSARRGVLQIGAWRAAEFWRYWWVRVLMLPLLLVWWLLRVLTWPLRVAARGGFALLRYLSGWRNAYLLSLLLCTLVVNVTGFRGARLTHGTEHSLLPVVSRSDAVANRPTEVSSVYYRQVRPVLWAAVR